MGTRKMVREPPGEQLEFLSSVSAHWQDRRRALLVVLISLLVFVVAVPFAQVPLFPLPAFIPIYQSALIINDAITAIMIFAQFAFVRSRALLVLASAYFFTAIIAAVHMLTFPGLFSPAGLLDAGPQTTAWLYMFWHGTFPLAVIVYALLKRSDLDVRWPLGFSTRSAILLGMAVASGLAFVFGVLATGSHGLLPAIMDGHKYTAAMILVVSMVWIVSFLALVVLWIRRPHSLLDLWLMVVMCAWIFDIGLSAVFNAGRFDLGFYAGRVYGLLAASFVLVVLMLETKQLYARFLQERAQHTEDLQRANEDLERAYRELKETQVQLIQSEKLSSLGELVAGIAHEVNNPLAYASAHLATISSSLDKLRAEAGEGISENAEKLFSKASQRAVEARHGLERVVDIITRLRSFSRLDEGEFKSANISECIDSALKLVSHKFKNTDIVVDAQYAEDNWIYCAPGNLNQAFLNLISNAVDAVDGVGTIRIRTGRELNAYWISIADSGAGVDEAIRDRIFEPFFTTKDVGKGTGLGLPITYRIVEHHKGTLEVKRSDLGGAEFCMRLPSNLGNTQHAA